MERDDEYDAYLSKTAAERIDAEYERWIEQQASASDEFANTSADLDAMAYA